MFKTPRMVTFCITGCRRAFVDVDIQSTYYCQGKAASRTRTKPSVRNHEAIHQSDENFHPENGRCISDLAHPNRLNQRKDEIARAAPWRQTTATSSGRVASTTLMELLLGAAVPAGQQPDCTTAKGGSRGEWRRPKSQHEPMTAAALSPVGQHVREKTLASITARGRSMVAARRPEIQRGFTTATELILGRAETSDGTTKYYDKAGKYVRRKTK